VIVGRRIVYPHLVENSGRRGTCRLLQCNMLIERRSGARWIHKSLRFESFDS